MFGETNNLQSSVEASNIFSAKGEEYLNSNTKRCFDIVLSTMLIPPALIGSLIGALPNLFDGEGAAFFSSKRLDSNFEEFAIWKIRSMVKNADALKASIGDDLYNEARDARVTLWGSIIRHYKIDELPQFFDVIMGKLSVVGPRPITIDFFETHLGDNAWSEDRVNDWKKSYSAAKPGLTSFFQLTGSKKDWNRYHYDKFYAKNASLSLDCYLVFRTIKMILGRAKG